MRAASALPFVFAALLAACESVSEKEDPLANNVIDNAGLSNLLLESGDANQAIAYFTQALAEEPERADFRRGLAVSYQRAGRLPEAARVYQELDSLGQATPADQLDHAFLAIRLDRWEDAAAIDARLPGGLDSPRRHLLTAMIADNSGDWEAADAAYGQAERLATAPAPILNNWGVSLMSREDYPGAERLFLRAINYDSTLFNAKNNLAVVRGLQGNYRLPPVPMSDIERATILNNLGVIALRNERPDIARGLFAAAVDAHPQHYDGAARRLASLEGKVEY